MTLWRLYTVLLFVAIVAAAIATYQVAWGWDIPYDGGGLTASTSLMTGNTTRVIVPAVSSSSHAIVYRFFPSAAGETWDWFCGEKRVWRGVSTATVIPQYEPATHCHGYSLKLYVAGTGNHVASYVYTTQHLVEPGGASLSATVLTDNEGYYWWLSLMTFFGLFWAVAFYFRRR